MKAQEPPPNSGAVAETPDPNALFEACRIVFGAEVEISSQFLKYLQMSGLKSAFRGQAKKLHPDLQPAAAASESSDAFGRLMDAYEVLSQYLINRERPALRARLTGFSSESVGTSPISEPFRPKARSGSYYKGPIPKLKLEFGLYLYYRGLISSEELFEAVRWQRKQRPALGKIAQKWGWLDAQEITRVLHARGVRGRFGEKCEQLGLLTSGQVRCLVHFQRIHQRRFGEYFVERGILNHSEIRELLAAAHFHNTKVNHSL